MPRWTSGWPSARAPPHEQREPSSHARACSASACNSARATAPAPAPPCRAPPAPAVELSPPHSHITRLHASTSHACASPSHQPHSSSSPGPPAAARAGLRPAQREPPAGAGGIPSPPWPASTRALLVLFQMEAGRLLPSRKCCTRAVVTGDETCPDRLPRAPRRFAARGSVTSATARSRCSYDAVQRGARVGPERLHRAVASLRGDAARAAGERAARGGAGGERARGGRASQAPAPSHVMQLPCTCTRGP